MNSMDRGNPNGSNLEPLGFFLYGVDMVSSLLRSKTRRKNFEIVPFKDAVKQPIISFTYI